MGPTLVACNEPQNRVQVRRVRRSLELEKLEMQKCALSGASCLVSRSTGLEPRGPIQTFIELPEGEKYTGPVTYVTCSMSIYRLTTGQARGHHVNHPHHWPHFLDV